jgi:hexosaminidase
VTVGAATDANKSALAEQAYRVELASDRVAITGNTATGLFYGVQTMAQLLKPENGKLRLPGGQIEDWPDLELRVIYWDNEHHLEHPDVLKGGATASVILQDQWILDQDGRPFGDVKQLV